MLLPSLMEYGALKCGSNVHYKIRAYILYVLSRTVCVRTIQLFGREEDIWRIKIEELFLWVDTRKYGAMAL